MRIPGLVYLKKYMSATSAITLYTCKTTSSLAYFEYVGKDFAADMAKMAADTCTQKWWSETDPCQEPIATAKDGDWWTTMEEVFHND